MPTLGEWLAIAWVWVRTRLTVWKQDCSHTAREIKRRKTNYCLGFCACFLVVLVVALLVSIISNSPIIFLRLSELEAGEIDLEVEAGSWTQYTRLNYTLVSELLSSEDKYTYNTPRYEYGVSAFSFKDCSPQVQGLDPYGDWKYFGIQSNDSDSQDPCVDDWNCFTDYCPDAGQSATLFLMDLDREARMGIGRDWTLPKVPPGKAYLQSGLAKVLGVNTGDYIILFMFGPSVLGSEWPSNSTNDTMSDGGDNPTPTVPGGTNNPLTMIEYLRGWVFMTVQVAGVYSDAQGKYASDTTSAIIMDYSTFMKSFAPQVNNTLACHHPSLPLHYTESQHDNCHNDTYYNKQRTITNPRHNHHHNTISVVTNIITITITITNIAITHHHTITSPLPLP